MALAPKRGKIALPATANIAAIIEALGTTATDVRYDNGVLYVTGFTDAELAAIAEPLTDPSYGIRALKKQQAQVELQARIDAGMLWQGLPLQIDERSQARITSAAVAASLEALPEGFTWRMADNSGLGMDNFSMLTMATAAFQYIFALRARYWNIVDAVTAAPDAEAVEAIDPTTGWPLPPT